MTTSKTVAAAVSEKERIGQAKLAFLVHTMLVDRRNSDGKVITGGVVSALVNELYKELNTQYRLDRRRVQRAFDLLHPLELRGDANLKKSGMVVADTVPADYYIRVGELRAKLQATELENAAMKRELTSLRELHQTISSSLARHNENMQSP